MIAFHFFIHFFFFLLLTLFLFQRLLFIYTQIHCVYIVVAGLKYGGTWHTCVIHTQRSRANTQLFLSAILAFLSPFLFPLSPRKEKNVIVFVVVIFIEDVHDCTVKSKSKCILFADFLLSFYAPNASHFLVYVHTST